jgi:hypothetical protein
MAKPKVKKEEVPEKTVPEWPVGQRITKIRVMTPQEMKQQGWDYGNAIVLELEDGSRLYPSQDEEGNGPGALFGVDEAGDDVVIFPSAKP